MSKNVGSKIPDVVFERLMTLITEAEIPAKRIYGKYQGEYLSSSETVQSKMILGLNAGYFNGVWHTYKEIHSLLDDRTVETPTQTPMQTPAAKAASDLKKMKKSRKIGEVSFGRAFDSLLGRIEELSEALEAIRGDAEGSRHCSAFANDPPIDVNGEDPRVQYIRYGKLKSGDKFRPHGEYTEEIFEVVGKGSAPGMYDVILVSPVIEGVQTFLDYRPSPEAVLISPLPSDASIAPIAAAPSPASVTAPSPKEKEPDFPPRGEPVNGRQLYPSQEIFPYGGGETVWRIVKSLGENRYVVRVIAPVFGPEAQQANVTIPVTAIYRYPATGEPLRASDIPSVDGSYDPALDAARDAARDPGLDSSQGDLGLGREEENAIEATARELLSVRAGYDAAPPFKGYRRATVADFAVCVGDKLWSTKRLPPMIQEVIGVEDGRFKVLYLGSDGKSHTGWRTFPEFYRFFSRLNNRPIWVPDENFQPTVVDDVASTLEEARPQ